MSPRIGLFTIWAHKKSEERVKNKRKEIIANLITDQNLCEIAVLANRLQTPQIDIYEDILDLLKNKRVEKNKLRSVEAEIKKFENEFDDEFSKVEIGLDQRNEIHEQDKLSKENSKVQSRTTLEMKHLEKASQLPLWTYIVDILLFPLSILIIIVLGILFLNGILFPRRRKDIDDY